MDGVADEIYNLIESLLPQSTVGSGFTSDLLSLVHAVYAKEKDNLSLIVLPVLCCQATDGDAHRAIPVAAAWQLLYLAAQVLDDIEDGETDHALWVTLGKPQALNIATGLIFASQRALSGLPRWGVYASLTLTFLDDFGRTILRMCAGQHADLAAQNGADLPLEQYQAIVAAKSGDFFALACRVGAMLGAGDAHQVAHYAEFGYNLGVLLQISDDLVGLWESGPRNDLAAGQQTLPMLYAMSVAAPRQRAVLRELLLQAPGDAGAETEARQMIIALGAPIYLLAEAQVHRLQAEAAVRAAGQFSPASDQLLTLVDRVMPGLSLIHLTGDAESDLFSSQDIEGR